MTKYFVSAMLFGSLLLSGCAKTDDGLRAGTIREITAQSTFEPVDATPEAAEESARALVDSTNATGQNVAQTVSPTVLASAVIEQREIVIPVVEAATPSADYLVGPNDVLFINVSGKPEFSSATAAGSIGSRGITGSRVDGNGDIQFPFVGTVHVGGLTLVAIQTRLTELLQAYLKTPWVVVEVVEYKSQPLYLLGQFRNSGTFYLDRPLNLLQGVALGNGFDATANLSASRLIRDKKIVAVDLYELLTKGDQSQNIWLRPGDTLFIPDNKNMQVFVFGAVKKPGAIPVPREGISLSQALASAEIRDTGYDIGKVRIIRSHSATRGELLVVDFGKMLKGEVLPMSLKEGDVIYVPKSGVGNWNDALTEILPSLQVFSAALQPFVNIKYLSN